MPRFQTEKVARQSKSGQEQLLFASLYLLRLHSFVGPGAKIHDLRSPYSATSILSLRLVALVLHHVVGQPRPRLLAHAKCLARQTRSHINPAVKNASVAVSAPPKTRLPLIRHSWWSRAAAKTPPTRTRRRTSQHTTGTAKEHCRAGRRSHTTKSRIQKIMAGHEVLGWRAGFEEDEAAFQTHQAHLAQQ